jgi:hypothetical protein
LNPINKSNPPIASKRPSMQKMQEQQQRFRHILQHLLGTKSNFNPKLLSIGDQGIPILTIQN